MHAGQEQHDFFAGYSMPRNKTLMRVFKDLGMVEYLGSGMPRIPKAYPRDSYSFSSHFVRTTFPMSKEALALEQEVAATDRRLCAGLESGLESIRERILSALTGHPLSKSGLARAIGQKSASGKLHERVREMLGEGLVEYTIPDKPNSRLQEYRLTDKGRALLGASRQGS